ncbi:MAG: sugar phosphate isomerase/epimerase family protein [Thermoguttaceae bacterium]|jgi:sugar phosphate isomerase/epimerase
MKFALCNEMFQTWSIENQFEAFAAWGYDGAELAPFSLDPVFASGAAETMELDRIDDAICDRILAASRSSDVAVSGLHWILAKTSGFHLTTHDEETRQRTSAYLCRLAELCAKLGGSYMVLGSPAQRNVEDGSEYADAKQNALKTIEAVLPTLQKVGVTLALEALAPTETNFWVNSEETLAFIEELGDPETVTLHLDCRAMFGGEYQDIPEVIKRVGREHKTVSFHANDPNLQGPGFGQLDFKPIMRALADVKFEGWIGVEPFDYSPGIVELGRESIRNLKNAMDK